MEKINLKAVQISEQQTIRFAQIYWLAMILPHTDDDDDLGCVIEDYEDYYHEIHHAMGVEISHGCDLCQSIISDHRFGFLAKVERPVMGKIGYSWSQYQCTWVYAESLDALLVKAQEAYKLLEISIE